VPSQRLFGLRSGDDCIRNDRGNMSLAARALDLCDTARIVLQIRKLWHGKSVPDAICAKQTFPQTSYQSGPTAAQELS
jgi:hypothetical protein